MTAVYAILVELFPRRLRRDHGDEMKLVFRNLLDDPEVSFVDLLKRVIGDCQHLLGAIVIGVLLGLLVVLIWYAVRSDFVPYDPTLGVLEISFLFAFAGFIGAWRSGTYLGGLMVGLTVGLVSSATVPGDYFWFGVFPADDLYRTLAMAVGFAVILVSIGAVSSSVLRRLLPSRVDVRSPNPRA